MGLLVDGVKRKLLDLIKRRGELDLAQAIGELKLAKTTLRAHLFQLERQGLIARRYMKSSALGRPRLLFVLAEEGQRLYPSQEPIVLRELLRYLSESGHAGLVRKFFESYWQQRRSRFETILSTMDAKKESGLQARRRALQVLLEEEGFMPEVSQGSGARTLVRECNCPFTEAIKATKYPCKLELAFMSWALNSDIQRTEHILQGDSACTYVRSSSR